MAYTPTPTPHSHGPSWCWQVYLAPGGTSAEYGSILVDINKKIKQDLALSGNLSSLYAMTQDKVSLKMAPGGCCKTGPGDTLGLALDGWPESGFLSLSLHSTITVFPRDLFWALGIRSSILCLPGKSLITELHPQATSLIFLLSTRFPFLIPP